MRNDAQNIRAPRRDERSRKRIIYLVCVIIMVICLILDIFFVTSLLPA